MAAPTRRGTISINQRLILSNGKIHHAIKNGKPSISIRAMASMAMLNNQRVAIGNGYRNSWFTQLQNGDFPYIYIYIHITGWWFGTWMDYFLYGMSSFPLTKSYFSRWLKPPTSSFLRWNLTCSRTISRLGVEVTLSWGCKGPATVTVWIEWPTDSSERQVCLTTPQRNAIER